MEYRKMTEMEIIKYLNDSMNSEFEEECEIANILLKHHNLELNKLQYRGDNNKIFNLKLSFTFYSCISII